MPFRFFSILFRFLCLARKMPGFQQFRDKEKGELKDNKYNFRLHELAAQLIALNNSIPAAQKWTKFQTAIGNTTYTLDQLSLKNHLPGRVKWMLTKKDFDERIAYIIKNKNNYTDRLKKRAADYKLS